MLKSKTLLIIAAAALVAVLLGFLLVLGVPAWRQAARRPSPAVHAFWDRFRETNAAWLNPEPPAMSYELVLQQKDRKVAQGEDFWRDTSTLQTWCTPEQNVRFIEKHLDWNGALSRTTEERYFRGRGGRVTLKPSSRLDELKLDLWLAGRTGAGFLNFAHLMAAWGVPDSAMVQTPDDLTVMFRVTNLTRLNRSWRRDFMVGPAYGLHPASFATETEVWPESLEVIADRATLLPLTMREVDSRGKTEAQVTFEPPWLELRGRKVPGVVRCTLPAQQYDLRYEFAVEQGIWLLKELVRNHATGYSLCCRSYTRHLVVGPVPDARFPSPADLELPEQSVTTLSAGERMVTVPTRDGLSLEAKLSLPPSATNRVPVVFFLPGAGPWTFDRPIVYPDPTRVGEMMPEMKVSNYCDFFARELASRGIGFFRMNKRGCGIVRDDVGYPREIVNRSLFSKVTPSVLLADYEAALQTLRRQPGVDPGRIVLLGASEGTRLAPRLALSQSGGIAAVVLFGYSQHGTKETIRWQHTVGPWRNIARIFDADDDGEVTRKEYEEVVRLKGKIVSDTLPYSQLDKNRDGLIRPSEMDQQARAEAVFKAVRMRNDDYLWDNLLNLSSAYLLEEWEAPPTHQTLLRLDLPLAIFHGENDGTCRVEGAREAERAFANAGRTNLMVRVYAKTDHDLNWAGFLKDGKMPPAFTDLVDYIARAVEPRPH